MIANNVYQQLKQLQKEHKWQKIVDLLKPLVQTANPRRFELSSLGFAYSQLDRYDEARYCYKKWLELEPNSARPYYCLGYLYYDDQQWHEAIEWFDQALELDAGYINCLYRKGIAEYRLLKFNKAKDTMKYAIKSYLAIKDDDELRRLGKYFIKSVFYLGKIYYQLKQYSNAFACFKKVIDEDKRNYIQPEFKEYNIAKGFFGMGKNREARQTLEKYMADNRVKEYYFDLLGRIFATENDEYKALKSFKTAIKIRPASYIYIHRAQFFEKLKKLNEALPDYHQALRRDKHGKHKILLAIGLINIQLCRLSEAKVYIIRAIEFKKKIYEADYYEAHLALAEYYKLSNHDEEAKNEFKIAATLAPAWADQYVPV